MFAWSADVDRITMKFGSMIDRNQLVFVGDTSQARDICHIIGVYNSVLEPGEGGDDGLAQEVTEITGMQAAAAAAAAEAASDGPPPPPPA